MNDNYNTCHICKSTEITPTILRRVNIFVMSFVVGTIWTWVCNNCNENKYHFEEFVDRLEK